METTNALLESVLDAIDDLKATNVKTYDVKGISSFTDVMVIATGSSNRQVNAIARNVSDKSKKKGHKVLGMEGEQTGEWVLVDLGDVVVHIMQAETRDFYQLEKLWSRDETDDSEQPPNASSVDMRPGHQE